MNRMWANVRIGDVCQTGAGGTPLKSNNQFYEGGTIPWVLSGEVSNRDITHTKNFITTLGLDNSSAKIFPKNTVLVAMYGATAGQVGILRIEAATNQAVCGIYPNENVVPEYVYYALLYKQKELVDTAAGNAQPNISQIKVKNTVVPMPPLTEQKRIVAILDEAFAGIEMAITNTERNFANARELFEGYLDAIFNQSIEKWKVCKLGEVYEIGSSKRVHKHDWQDQGVPFYRAREIVKLAKQGYVNNELFISEDLFQEYKSKTGAPAEGDLMVTAVGTLGVCYAVRSSDRFYFKDASVLWFRPKCDMDPGYMEYAFRSSCVKDQTTDSQGATVGTLTISRANTLEIPIPPINDQQQIVAKLNELRQEAQRLESIYQQKLTALAELKQSLLQKAFSGELTADKVENKVQEAVA